MFEIHCNGDSVGEEPREAEDAVARSRELARAHYGHLKRLSGSPEAFDHFVGRRDEHDTSDAAYARKWVWSVVHVETGEQIIVDDAHVEVVPAPMDVEAVEAALRSAPADDEPVTHEDREALVETPPPKEE